MKNSAFTLIELVVSLAIFAVMATLAYSGLNQMLIIKEKNEEHQAFLDQIQNTYLQLKKDFFYINLTNNRDEYGQITKSFTQDSESLFEFSSANRINPLALPQNKVNRIKYFLEEEKLFRSFSHHFNLAPNATLKKRILLSDIEFINVRFLDKKNTWLEYWSKMILPEAIELNIVFEKYGEFKWLFSL